jgi:hypothetical protein
MPPGSGFLRVRRRGRPGRSRKRSAAGPEPESASTHAAAKLPLFLQKETQVTKPGDSVETEADRIADQILHGRRGESDGPTEATRGENENAKGAGSDRAFSGGRPLSPELQKRAEKALGVDLDSLRVHDNAEAQQTAGMLGARAFARGDDICLGPGASESDQGLMAHELAHVHQKPDAVALRSATYFERRAWLSFFSHYLPRKFLNNYMDDTGNPITLTVQEMMDVNPRVNIKASPGFRTHLASLVKESAANAAAGTPGPAIRYIEVKGPGQAMTNGTLGNFTINYKGILTASADGSWSFVGFMTFYDYWDFDPKPWSGSGRSTAGELKTRVGAYFIPGQPFEIFSEAAPIAQAEGDPRATWAGGTPKFVNDRAGVAGSDIAGGDVVGGPEGAEVGAQGAEDINE